jgi:hypothetical protein
MKRVDPSHLCISATVGLVMRAGLEGRASVSAARSDLVRTWWISSGFVAPSTRMGPPLTESPGQCRVCERVHAGSPKGQTQPRAAWNACSGDGGNNGAASGTDREIEGSGAFQERPAMTAGKATAHAPRRRPRTCRPGGDSCSGSKPEALSAGHDCDAVGSIRSRARTAIGKPQLTPSLRWGQDMRAATGLISLRLRVANAWPGRAREPHLFSRRAKEQGCMRA